MPPHTAPLSPGQVWAPTTKYQLHGITRQTTLDLCRGNGIPVRELDFSLTKVGDPVWQA